MGLSLVELSLVGLSLVELSLVELSLVGFSPCRSPPQNPQQNSADCRLRGESYRWGAIAGELSLEPRILEPRILEPRILESWNPGAAPPDQPTTAPHTPHTRPKHGPRAAEDDQGNRTKLNIP